MGIFDAFFGSDSDPKLGQQPGLQSGFDPRTMGLLSAAAAALEAGGPSRVPVSNGQAIARMLSGGVSGYNSTLDRQADKELRDLRMKQFGLGMEKDSLELQQLRDAMERESRIRSRLPGAQPTQPGMPNATTPASFAPGGPMSPKIGAPDWMQAYQAQQPQAATPPQTGMQPRTQKNATRAFADGLIAEANIRREEGDTKTAIEMYDKATKFMPKVKNWQEVNHNGKVLYAPFYEDGTAGEPVPYEVAEKLEFRNLGGKTVGLNPFTGEEVAGYRNTQSPDSVASNAIQIRGQNLTDARGKEANKIAAQANTIVGGKQNFEAENKLFDDHKAQSKTFIDVRDGYTRINSALKHATTSAAATLAGATSFMKLLDPGSVVRESELGMALAATGVFDRAANYFNTLQRGKVLTESQAKDFQNIADQLYQAAEQNQRALDAQYSEQAKGYGLNPKNVVKDYYTKKPSSTDASSGKEITAAGSRPDASKNLLPSLPTANASNRGKMAIDHQTGKRYRSNGMQWTEEQ